MFRRPQEKKNVYIITRHISEDTHHFMDVAASEQVARRSVEMTFPQGFNVREEMIGQYGVEKKIHFTPVDNSPKIVINCMEPNDEAMKLG
jgi:hypothetical protein